MNERILDLARQVWPDPNTSHVNHEKFAQLIVEECAKVCDLYAMPDGTSETAIILASAIRRKFGVDK